MELTVPKSALLAELLAAQGAVERKTTIPALGHFLLDARHGRLRVAATDLNIAIEGHCAPTVKSDGACALPARKLLDYVKLLPDADITVVKRADSMVSLRCGGANCRMVGYSAGAFPELPSFPAEGSVSLPAAALRAMIARSVFATAADDNRHAINGALLVLKPNSMALVATDGHRLACCPGAKEGDAAGSALVPAKAVTEIVRLIEAAGSPDAIEFGQSETHVFFRAAGEAGPRQLSARKLSGQFPNYEAVLPKPEGMHIATVSASALAESLRRLAQFAGDGPVVFEFGPNALTVSAESNDVGRSEERVEAQYSGPAARVGLNGQYVSQFLAAAGAEAVELRYRDNQSACELRPVTDDANPYRYVVMPMRLK